MSAARRHYLMALRDHLAEDLREHEDDDQGQRARFLLDHLAEHLAPVDWRMVAEVEAAMGRDA